MIQSSSDSNMFTGVIEPNKIISLDGVGAVRAHVEVAFKSAEGDLVLIGWLFDPESRVRGVSVLLQKQEGLLKKPICRQWPLEHEVGKVQWIRVPRPDVTRALSSVGEASDDRHGLVLVVPSFPAEGRLAFALDDGRFAVLPFVALNGPHEIKRALANCWGHSGATLCTALKKSLGDDNPLTQLVSPLAGDDNGRPEKSEVLRTSSPREQDDVVKFHIEGALSLAHGLVLIGWTTAGVDGAVHIHLSDAQGRRSKTLLLDGAKGMKLIRVFRPDLRNAMPAGAFGDGLHGFVLYWPLDTKPPRTISVGFDGSPRAQEAIRVFPADNNVYSVLLPLWIHSGNALKKIAEKLTEEHSFSFLLEELETEKISQVSLSFAGCDHALLLNNRALILNGWIVKPASDALRIELVTGRANREITSRIKRYPRPDLVPAYPWSSAERLGFLVVLDDPWALSCDVKLKICCDNGQIQVLRPEVQVMDWPALGEYLNHQSTLAELLLALLADTAGLEDDAGRLRERIAWLRRGSFLARYSHLPTFVDHPETVIAAIDRAYALGEAGLLIFGWQLTPKLKPISVTVRGSEGEAVDITNRMSALARLDVVQNYRKRFPQANEWCGFVCLAPLPTSPGEARVLCFDFGDAGETRIKIPTDRSEKAGVELIKEILGIIPAPDKLRGSLFEVFSDGLGNAIEAISNRRPTFSGKIEERQFGRPPLQPGVSVIVPLYGRYDFIRHQLAHFADDQDFDKADLIYVIDDPNIIVPALDMAAAYHQLFEKPFRVVFYGQNLGFAGANNVGVKVARADTILLLNSDIIPMRAGWLTRLRHALDTLPQAGAVGPLLLYSDDSIQHAGMRPMRDPFFPGFLLNIHPGKGQVWHGPDGPSEHPLLTAACLMLKKKDYLDLGGLDEGYIIGDFEDSDLCLALRKHGKRLWLVPEAKLWHLERQSQNMESIAGYRQLLTLYNGWRYQKKIQNGLIADPEQDKPELLSA